MLAALTPDRLAEHAAAERLSVGLSRALDSAGHRPCLRGDVEFARFTTRWGDRYAIAHSPRSGRYLRLSIEEADLASSLDGTHSLGELVVSRLDARGDLEVAQLADLVSVLDETGFLEHRPVDVYAELRERLTPRVRRAGRRTLRWLRAATISFPHIDDFVGVLYRSGGRLLFTPAANAVALAVLVSGLVAFVSLARRGGYALFGTVSTGDAFVLLALGVAALFVHEMGHALAVRRAGRTVVRAGLQLYLGHPTFFIDSSDMLLAPRGARAVNAVAGPYAEAVVGGAAAAVAWCWPHAGFASVLFRFAGISYLSVLVNLIPFVELDGYWLVTDLLDVSRLRPRSLAVLRHELPERLRRRRPRLTRAELGLAAFGVLGGLATVAALATAWAFWGPIVRRVAVALWGDGWVGRVVLVLLFGLIAGPLLPTLASLVAWSNRQLRAVAGDVRFRLQAGWRVEAAEALRAAPGMGRLDDSALAKLAGRVTRHRVREGAVVVAAGDAADAFFVVRTGRFAVVEQGTDGAEQVLRHVLAGDTFGEVALLTRRPRTATVRAETDGELFAVDAGTFLRILAPVMAPAGLVPANWPLLEVWVLAPFLHLDRDEVALLVDRGEWVTYGPGEEIVVQGEPGADFYVIGAGQVEVLRDTRRIAVLRAGDHFGEIALLHNVERTATVRTLTPARVFRVDAATFYELVASSFARGAGAIDPGAREASARYR